jgi:hypothetical protein
MKNIQFRTPHKTFFATTVVVTKDCIAKGYAPTGSGDDYKFSEDEKRQLEAIFAGKMEEYDFEPRFPYLYKITSGTALTMMERGEKAWLSYAAMKEWKLEHQGDKTKAFTILSIHQGDIVGLKSEQTGRVLSVNIKKIRKRG